MARPARHDQTTVTTCVGDPQPAVVALTSFAIDREFHPGGQVGAMHAELARRLTGSEGSVPLVESPVDRAMRLASAAAGFGALAAAYAGVVLLFVR